MMCDVSGSPVVPLSSLGLDGLSHKMKLRPLGQSLGTLDINHVHVALNHCASNVLQREPYCTDTSSNYAENPSQSVEQALQYAENPSQSVEQALQYAENLSQSVEQAPQYAEKPPHYAERPLHSVEPSKHYAEQTLHYEERQPDYAGKPPDDAEKPSDDAEKPPDAAEKPLDDAEKPLDDAEKPLDDAEKPPDTAEKPLDDAEKPLDDAEKPPDAVEKPPDDAGKSSDYAGKPRDYAEKPPDAAEKPPDDADKPLDDAEKPPDAAEKPPDDEEKPPDDAEKPPDDAEKPPDDADKPPDDAEKPPDYAEKPLDDAEKPLDDAEKPPDEAEKSPQHETFCDQQVSVEKDLAYKTRPQISFHRQQNCQESKYSLFTLKEEKQHGACHGMASNPGIEAKDEPVSSGVVIDSRSLNCSCSSQHCGCEEQACNKPSYQSASQCQHRLEKDVHPKLLAKQHGLSLLRFASADQIPPEAGRNQSSADQIPPEAGRNQSSADQIPPEAGRNQASADQIPPEAGRNQSSAPTIFPSLDKFCDRHAFTPTGTSMSEIHVNIATQATRNTIDFTNNQMAIKNDEEGNNNYLFSESFHELIDPALSPSKIQLYRKQLCDGMHAAKIVEKSNVVQQIRQMFASENQHDLKSQHNEDCVITNLKSSLSPRNLHNQVKPYRQWQRISQVVAAESKFIVSSDCCGQGMSTLEGKAFVDSERKEPNATGNNAVYDAELASPILMTHVNEALSSDVTNELLEECLGGEVLSGAGFDLCRSPDVKSEICSESSREGLPETSSESLLESCLQLEYGGALGSAQENTRDQRLENRMANGQENTRDQRLENRMTNGQENTMENRLENRMANAQENTRDERLEKIMANGQENTRDHRLENRMANGQENTRDHRLENKMANGQENTRDHRLENRMANGQENTRDHRLENRMANGQENTRDHRLENRMTNGQENTRDHRLENRMANGQENTRDHRLENRMTNGQENTRDHRLENRMANGQENTRDHRLENRMTNWQEPSMDSWCMNSNGVWHKVTKDDLSERSLKHGHEGYRAGWSGHNEKSLFEERVMGDNIARWQELYEKSLFEERVRNDHKDKRAGWQRLNEKSLSEERVRDDNIARWQQLYEKSLFGESLRNDHIAGWQGPNENSLSEERVRDDHKNNKENLRVFNNMGLSEERVRDGHKNNKENLREFNNMGLSEERVRDDHKNNKENLREFKNKGLSEHTREKQSIDGGESCCALTKDNGHKNVSNGCSERYGENGSDIAKETLQAIKIVGLSDRSLESWCIQMENANEDKLIVNLETDSKMSSSSTTLCHASADDNDVSRDPVSGRESSMTLTGVTWDMTHTSTEDSSHGATTPAASEPSKARELAPSVCRAQLNRKSSLRTFYMSKLRRRQSIQDRCRNETCGAGDNLIRRLYIPRDKINHRSILNSVSGVSEVKGPQFTSRKLRVELTESVNTLTTVSKGPVLRTANRSRNRASRLNQSSSNNFHEVQVAITKRQVSKSAAQKSHSKDTGLSFRSYSEDRKCLNLNAAAKSIRNDTQKLKKNEVLLDGKPGLGGTKTSGVMDSKEAALCEERRGFETVATYGVINESIINEPIINEPIINEPIINEPIINETTIATESKLLQRVNRGDLHVHWNESVLTNDKQPIYPDMIISGSAAAFRTERKLNHQPSWCFRPLQDKSLGSYRAIRSRKRGADASAPVSPLLKL